MDFLCVLWAYQTEQTVYMHVCYTERCTYVFRTIFFFYMFLTRLSSVFVIFSEDIITDALESYSQPQEERNFFFHYAHCLRFFFSFFFGSLPFVFFGQCVLEKCILGVYIHVRPGVTVGTRIQPKENAQCDGNVSETIARIYHLSNKRVYIYAPFYCMSCK